jgi:hypothetical protein
LKSQVIDVLRSFKIACCAPAAGLPGMSWHAASDNLGFFLMSL